jgi:hypothetical protein
MSIKKFITGLTLPLLMSSGVASAENFIITGSNDFTNGVGTINGAAEAPIADNAINGSDTVSLGVALTTTSNSEEGIQTSGGTNNIAVSSSGSITTAGSSAYGIYNDGDSNTTTMSGSITTAGSNADGISNNGASNTTTMSGNITTTGSQANGIKEDGDGNTTTTMSGNITTTGFNANGIYNEADSNTTTMLGSITTAGSAADGIINLGDSNTTTISGIVSATGAASSALHNYSGSGNSFTLGEGATIIGDITALAAATNNKLTLNLGQGTSYAYSVGGGGVGTSAGQWTFTDQDGRTPVVTTSGTNCAATGVTVCNLVTSVSTGNAEAQDELQFETNRSMIGSLQFGNGQADAPSNTWVNVYGGTSKRASSTTYLSFDTRNSGLTIGTPVAINGTFINGTFNMDLVFNTSSANLDIGLTTDQEITVKSYNIGAVVHDLAPFTGLAVNAFGFIGRNSYDGKRKVMNNDTASGSETVTASYSGMEVLMGIDAQYSNPINTTLSFIGGMNASLSYERMDAYSESKYFAWDARTMTQATGGITAGLEYHTDALTTFASLGAQRSSLQNGKTAGYTNNGTAGSYTDSANGDTYRTASIGFDYAVEGGMSVTGAVEQLSSSGGVSGNSASLSVNRKF